jgi:hypothetical protein
VLSRDEVEEEARKEMIRLKETESERIVLPSGEEVDPNYVGGTLVLYPITCRTKSTAESKTLLEY